MTPADWGGWKALYRVEPWGCDQDDIRAGVIAATMANIHRDVKERPLPYKPADFVKRTRATEEAARRDRGAIPSTVATTPGDMLRMVESMSIALGGRDHRKRKPRYD